MNMDLDKTFLTKLKENGILDEHVRSIIDLCDRIKGYYQVVMGTGESVPAYLFRHKLVDDNAVFQIDAKGWLWVQRPAVDKLCAQDKEDKVATLYKSLKQLTGWKWADHTSTKNPGAAVEQWHDKVGEMAAAFIDILSYKDDDDLDEGEEM